MEMVEAGYVAPGVVFVDGTHIKANANTKKVVKKEVPITAKRYAEELMEEVNADREAHGKKPFEDDSDEDDHNEPPTAPKKKRDKDCVKTVTRHIWKDYEEMADDTRYTPIYQRMYKARKETIERVFADAKEKHGLRYTRYTGLAQVTNWVKLCFAAMNLKKFAKWSWKDKRNSFVSCIIFLIYPQYTPILCLP